MKRKLQQIYWAGILITLAVMASAMAIMVSIKIDDTRSHLRSILHAASAWTLESSSALQNLAESIAEVSPPLRVTFMMDHGLVLADSEGDVLTMESHYDRPEVVQARANGTGESLRFSGTQMSLVMYMAKRISPQLIVRLSFPLDEITRLLYYYALGLVLMALFLFFLQRRALNRFSAQLQQQMDEVRMVLEGSRSEAGVIFPELGPAVDNINYLAGRLSSDLEEVTRTLNLRSDFVANASHELRSPLTSIMGFAEMLDEGLADSKEEQELCVKTIRSECGRMLMVIEDILHLSKTEKQEAPALAPVSVHELAQEVCLALSPQAGQKSISLCFDGEMVVHGVEKDVWEILYNLVDNAIRYGKQCGRVDIAMKGNSLTVSDDGVGIEEKHLPRLFEQFYRVDETREMSAGGTGLGLSIVHALVVRMGGRIEVESEIGIGTAFTVTFMEEGKAGENA